MSTHAQTERDWEQVAAECRVRARHSEDARAARAWRDAAASIETALEIERRSRERKRPPR